MATEEEAEVLVIGGGPVGLTMAAELSYRGIKTFLLEKKATTSDLAKAVALNSRTMEHFRRLGLQEKLQDSSYPPDMHFNVMACTKVVNGKTIFHLKLASRQEVLEGTTDRKFPFYEIGASVVAPIFIPQSMSEPVIKEHLETSEVVKMHWGVTVTSVEQDDDGVTVNATQSGETDSKEKIFKAKYVVACDGGSSPTRSMLGAHTFGKFVIARAVSIVFSSPEVYTYMRSKDNAGITFVMTGKIFGLMILLNSKGEFALHVLFAPDTPDEELNNRAQNAQEMVADVLGEGVSFNLITASGYNMHTLMSTKFREGRIFLAGDSAHQWLPAGGLGMNTGIGDVADLAWKLETALKGYAGPHMLDSYQIERRPLVNSTLNFAMSFGGAFIDPSAAKFRNFIVSTSVGRLIISSFAKIVSGAFNPGNEIILGFQYSNSNIIMHEYDEHGDIIIHPHSKESFTGYSLPGCRAPHVALPDCDSIIDLFGKKFVILTVGGEESDLSALKETLKTRGVPLETYCYPKLPELTKLYDRKYFLIRPDGVVAWRADYQPNTMEANKIVSTVLGDVAPKRLPPPIVRYNQKQENAFSNLCVDLFTRYGLTLFLAKYTELSMLKAGAIGFGVFMFLRALHTKPSPPDTQSMSRHQAVVLNEFGGDLKIVPKHVGEFGPNDVVIRVHAASINPIDLRLKMGYGAPMLRKLSKFTRKNFFPLILGRDCSGEVVAVGENVTKFLLGDQVYAALPPARQGGYTQLVAVDESNVAFKPSNVDHKEATCLPWVAVSTWTALVKNLGLNKYNTRGKKVLVHAGTGGVGSFAIQLLKAWGAEVATTCSTNNITLAHSLGADIVIDYTAGDFEKVLSDYDVVLDLKGFNYEKKSLSVLKWYKGAKYVSLIGPKNFLVTKLGGFLGELAYSWLYRYKVIMNRLFLGRSFYYSVAETNGEVLEEVRVMVEKGEIRPLIDAVYSMDEIVDAYKHVEGGHTRGKVVITVP